MIGAPKEPGVAAVTGIDSEGIILKSPLQIMGAIVFIMRERFGPGNHPTWEWRDAPDTNIVIETELQEDNSRRNARPAIFVGNDMMSAQEIVNGDYGDYNFKRGSNTGYVFTGGGITLNCISPKKSECWILADAVFSTMVMLARAIEKTTNLRKIHNVRMGKPTPYGSDKTSWNCGVQFNYQGDLSWASNPAQEGLLKKITVNAKVAYPGTSTYNSVDTYLHVIATGEE